MRPYLVTLGDRYDPGEALVRQKAATKAVWELMWRDAKKLDEVLNPAQLKLLPGLPAFLRNINEPPNFD